MSVSLQAYKKVELGLDQMFQLNIDAPVKAIGQLAVSVCLPVM